MASSWKFTCGCGLSHSAPALRTQKPGLPGRRKTGALCPAPCPAVASVTRALSSAPGPSALHPASWLWGAAPLWPFSGWQAAPAGSPCPGWPPAPAARFRTRSSAPAHRPGRRRRALRPPPVQRAPEGRAGEAHIPDGPPDDPQVLSGAQPASSSCSLGTGPPRSRACIPQVLVTGVPMLQLWGPFPKNDC